MYESEIAEGKQEDGNGGTRKQRRISAVGRADTGRVGADLRKPSAAGDSDGGAESLQIVGSSGGGTVLLAGDRH